MKKKIIVSTLIFTILICSGCKQEVKLKDGKEVVASISGKKITAEELFDELKESYGSTTITKMIDDFIVNKEITDDDEANEYAKAQDLWNKMYKVSACCFMKSHALSVSLLAYYDAYLTALICDEEYFITSE